MKLWSGRFTGQTEEAAAQFHSSIGFDKKLYRYDIKGSIAHARMLGKQNIIPKQDADEIVKTLSDILDDIETGALKIDLTAEDIHSFVESELVSRIGDAGRRLHTGRSRNDQVALDTRMYAREEIDITGTLLETLLETLLATARKHVSSVMPGFTHMQKAQPVTLAHHILAYFQMFKRDFERLSDCRRRVNVMPLGSGALAATTYPLDREFVKEELGFAEITANSLDAVSDRDFCVEFVSCLSMIMMHLSRFCEELILWLTDSFNFIEISDAYSTGSSIMPQKKNPDMAELIRGKTGRVFGNLTGLLTVMKGLPLAYNKDIQEDKEAVFDAVETTKNCLTVFTGMFGGLVFNTSVMRDSAAKAYTNATDAADWLVKKGLPFREAHEITGRLVLYAIGKKTPLEKLTLDELRSLSGVFDETFYQAVSVEACVNGRDLPGGTAEKAVLKAIEACAKFIDEIKKR